MRAADKWKVCVNGEITSPSKISNSLSDKPHSTCRLEAQRSAGVVLTQVDSNKRIRTMPASSSDGVVGKIAG